MKKAIHILLILPICLIGQNNDSIQSVLQGYWEGAFIKNNAYQKIDIQFRKSDDKLLGLQLMEEWHPTFGEFEVPVTIDSLNLISFGTGYGKAKLKLDNNNLELIGQVEDLNPSLYIHLKKTAEPPKSNYSLEKVSITSTDNVKLHGYLHVPNQSEHKTAIIFVGGRGCNSGLPEYNLYAKILREYGVTMLAYQKRGTGQSTGDCNKATITDLADDLVATKQLLENHPNNYKNIGVIGVSAGGWTMTKAEEFTDFDFMISIVGPSTSVKDQQLQSMSYGMDVYNLNSQAKENISRYTNLMFTANSEKDYTEMQQLLKSSKQQKWDVLLDDTDIPTSFNDIEDLWVRRHNYNPKNTLQTFDKPLLAIYGDRDWIVPQKENIELLEDYFAAKRNLLTTIKAYDAEHGMEMRARQVDLDDKSSYWHFYRISPQVKIEMIKFLRKHNFIE